MIFEECKHHKWKHSSHTCWNMQVRENSTSILRDRILRSLKIYEKMYPCEANLKGQGWLKTLLTNFLVLIWEFRYFGK